MPTAREELIARARQRAREQGAKNAASRAITVEELHQHNASNDLWVAVAGRVYDLSGFGSHPGGRGILEQCAGKDATDVFLVTHSPAVIEEKERFCIGRLEGGKEVPKLLTEFHEIDQAFRRMGWYETRMSYYIGKAAWQVALFAVALLPFVLEVEMTIAWTTLSAVALAIFWHQFAFLGHDFGHNAVFHDRETKDYIGGLIVTFFFGVSGQWWKKSHNVHHVVTNSVQGDPDIQHMPMFAVDKRQYSGYHSLYHKKDFLFDLASKCLISMQHWLYIPIMCVARVNLYVQSYIMVLTDPDCRNWRTELAVLLGYAWWMAELLLRFESAGMAAYWFFLSHAVVGLLHIQITISHFSMEAFETQEHSIHRTEDDDYVRHQLATSLDVDCPEWLDWLHGGLQFQVVHHLWPRIPRHRLREVRNKYLIPLCERHGLKYHRLGFFDCLGQTLRHLRARAMEARRTPVGSVSFAKSELRQFMNMDG